MIVIRGQRSLTPNFLVALGTLQTRRPASWAGFPSVLGSLVSKVARPRSALSAQDCEENGHKPTVQLTFLQLDATGQTPRALNLRGRRVHCDSRRPQVV